MNNGNNRRSMKKMISAFALLLAAVMLLGAASFTSCGKKTDDDKLIENQKDPGAAGEKIELTQNQKKAVFDAAEAFAEAHDEEDLDLETMQISEFEKFIYYLYNDELTAGENGYGKVTAEDADARLQSLFGTKTLRHTPKRPGMIQDFYCEDDNYFVRVKEKYAECKLGGAEWTDDGLARIVVSAETVKGVTVSFEFTAELRDGELTIRNCKRYDAI